MKILIVDDQQHIQRVMRLQLERASFEVICASNGKQGLQAYTTHQPDVIVSDIDMPGMNGIEMVGIIADAARENIPKIFICTSRTESEYRDIIERVPGLIFLEKPVSMRDLIAMISEVQSVEMDTAASQ